jgi:hypothetical protein
MRKMKNFKVRIAFLLLVWVPILLFSLSDLERDIKELEEKLKTAPGKEKIALINDFAAKYMDLAPDKSLEYAKQALQLAEKLNDPRGIFMSLNKIGNWHFIYEQYQEAVGYYLKEGGQGARQILMENKGETTDYADYTDSYFFSFCFFPSSQLPSFPASSFLRVPSRVFAANFLYGN